MSRFKKILLSLIVIGTLGSFTVVRVLAALSSESANPGATIASGTLTANMTLSSSASSGATSITVGSVPAAIASGTQLVLDDKSAAAGGHTNLVTVNGNVSASGSPVVISITGTLSFNFAAGTKVFTNNFNEQGCDGIYSSSVLLYPGVLDKALITIADDGTWDVTDLRVWMPNIGVTASGCGKVATPGIPAYAAQGGDPCASTDFTGGNGVLFYIQETQSNFSTAVQCWYPTTATTCPTSGSVGTLSDFGSGWNTSPNAADLGAGPLRADAKYQGGGSGPAGANKRYFVVGTELPANASNTLQGEAAQFTLAWHLQGTG